MAHGIGGRGFKLSQAMKVERVDSEDERKETIAEGREQKQQEKAGFDYAEHLDVIKSIRKQLQDSDERFERSISFDTRRRQLPDRTGSFNNKGALFTIAADPNAVDTPLAKDNGSLAFSKLQSPTRTEPPVVLDLDLDPNPDPDAAGEPTHKLEVESTFEYLKNIRRTETFKSDKERFDFLVSEIEILNKRIVILECEIDTLRHDNTALTNQLATTSHDAASLKAQLEQTTRDAFAREQSLQLELNAARNSISQLLQEVPSGKSPLVSTRDKKTYSTRGQEDNVHQLQAIITALKEEVHRHQLNEEATKQLMCVELQKGLLQDQVQALQKQLQSTERDKATLQHQVNALNLRGKNDLRDTNCYRIQHRYYRDMKSNELTFTSN